MNKMIALAFMVIGIVALCFAWDSYHSAASNVSRAVTGASTDKTLWLLIGGVFAAIVGVGGLLTASRKA